MAFCELRCMAFQLAGAGQLRSLWLLIAVLKWDSSAVGACYKATYCSIDSIFALIQFLTPGLAWKLDSVYCIAVWIAPGEKISEF